MTRKDYVLLAAALKAARTDVIAKEPPKHIPALLDGVGYAADWIADSLVRDNPRFDVERFHEAAALRVEHVTLETKS